MKCMCLCLCLCSVHTPVTHIPTEWCVFRSVKFERAYCEYRLNRTHEALATLRSVTNPDARTKELLAQVVCVITKTGMGLMWERFSFLINKFTGILVSWSYCTLTIHSHIISHQLVVFQDKYLFIGVQTWLCDCLCVHFLLKRFSWILLVLCVALKVVPEIG